MAAAAARHLLNPLATEEQIQHTPSHQDGISQELETDLRAYGALLIQQAGIQLRAPQVVMTTAAVLFQRFYYVSSFRNFGIKDIAAAALFLSSKLEEHPIRIRDLINCFDYLLKLVQWEAGQAALEKARQSLTASTSIAASAAEFVYQPMDYFAKEFYDWKDDIVIGESQILKRLGFNVTVQNPYGGIVNYLQVLNLTSHPTIPQLAWSFANDTLLTPLLVIYPAHYISVSAIYLACLLSSHPRVVLPCDPDPWWLLFDVDSEEEIWAICRVLLDLYRRWAGGTDWLVERGEGEGDGQEGGKNGLSRRKNIWRRAAELNLPITKDQVRKMLAPS